MTDDIDYWFQDTPSSVDLGKNQSSAIKHALRLHPCNSL
jgi:hypothetical protein